MNTFHKNIGKRWHEYSIFEQMANIGSEVERAIQWKGRNTEYSTLAFLRSMELLSYTIEDKKNRMRLKELTRLYELLGDYFLGDNLYHHLIHFGRSISCLSQLSQELMHIKQGTNFE